MTCVHLPLQRHHSHVFSHVRTVTSCTQTHTRETRTAMSHKQWKMHWHKNFPRQLALLSLSHTHKSGADKHQAITGMHCTLLCLSLSHTHTHAAPSQRWTRGPQGIELQPKAVTLAEKPAGHLHSPRSHRLHPSHHSALPVYPCARLSAYTDCLSKMSACAILQSAQLLLLSESIANETLDFRLSTLNHQLHSVIF